MAAAPPKDGGTGGTRPAVSPRASSVIGMVASLGTNLVLYPLDLIKVKLQGTPTTCTPRLALGIITRIILSFFLNKYNNSKHVLQLARTGKCWRRPASAHCARWWPAPSVTAASAPFTSASHPVRRTHKRTTLRIGQRAADTGDPRGDWTQG
jgi:hypothetical protein